MIKWQLVDNVLVIYLVGHWILDWPPASCQWPRGGGQVLVPGWGTEQDGHRGLSRGEVSNEVSAMKCELYCWFLSDNQITPPPPHTLTHTHMHTKKKQP